MSVYIVQGKLGCGKGKYVVGKMREALLEGRRVATNCDLFLEHLLPAQCKATAVRVPDKPTADDLLVIGHGNAGDRYDETKNGVMVLDELGTWLNSRTFQDKFRAAFIDWMLHARKHGWDVYLVAQNIDIVDKQVRSAMAEYQVKCIRADKMKIPLIGGVLGKLGKLPRFHIAVVSMTDVPGVKIDQEYYRGDDLHKGYDTLQIFRDWHRDPKSEGFQAETYLGAYSYLSAWHLKGRFERQTEKRSLLARLLTPAPVPRPSLKPKLPLVAKLSKLPPDKAWHFARLLNQQGAFA